MLDKARISDLTLHAIQAERYSQHLKFGKEPIANSEQMIAILGEEFGEICRAVCQGLEKSSIEIEVIQLAAVCIAYLDNDLHFGNQK